MYICLCNAITDRQIVTAAEEGARSDEDLAAQLGVGTGCGRCRSCAKALLMETVGRIATAGTARMFGVSARDSWSLVISSGDFSNFVPVG